MNKQFLKAKVLVKEEGGKITVVASDETLDRHGDVLPIDQWDLSKFKLAPRMLVDHNHTVASIVGRWSNVRIEGKQLLMDAVFHEITDLAKAVKEMVLQKFLDTVSVGFIYHDPAGDGQRPSFELIETSWVTVPANPSARVQASLKSAIEKEITADEEKKIKDFEGENEMESDDVLPEDDDDQKLEDDEEGEGSDAEEDSEDEGSDTEEEEEKIVSCKEDFEEFMFINRDNKVQFVKCDILFLTKLLDRSEQLETLTQNAKAREQADEKAKLSRLALKEASGLISHALREMNKVSD